MDKIRYFPLWLIVLSKLMAAPLRQPDPAQYICGLDELRSALQVPVHSSTWLRKKLFAWLIAKIYGMQLKMTALGILQRSTEEYILFGDMSGDKSRVNIKVDIAKLTERSRQDLNDLSGFCAPHQAVSDQVVNYENIGKEISSALKGIHHVR